MKILQVTNKVPYPAKDGGAIACMNLTRGFSLLGHSVTVLAMNTLKHNISSEEIPESIKDLASFHLVDVPARISWFGALMNLLFSDKPYNAVRFSSDSFADELKNLLKTTDFDVVQLEGLYVCPYIPIIRQNSNAIIVYRSHNIEHEIWERTANMARGIRRWYLKNLASRIKKFETKFLNKYDLLIPITERDGSILSNMGNAKPWKVSQTGIDSSSLIPNVKKLKHPSLFHIGSLEWTPNQEGLLWFLDSCWQEILQIHPELKFYIAGRNAPAWLQKKLNRKGVVFLGEVPDAYEFMNSKSIMLVPLFSGSGMRIKIIEGMALGKAIISTRIGTEGIGTTPGENIIVAETKRDFIEAVDLLINDKELFDKIGRNALDYIHEKFDNLTAAGALTDFYKQHIK